MKAACQGTTLPTVPPYFISLSCLQPPDSLPNRNFQSHLLWSNYMPKLSDCLIFIGPHTGCVLRVVKMGFPQPVFGGWESFLSSCAVFRRLAAGSGCLACVLSGLDS